MVTVPVATAYRQPLNLPAGSIRALLVLMVLCLIWARGPFEFSPLAMGLPFGVGQFLSAAILYWTLERSADDVLGQTES